MEKQEHSDADADDEMRRRKMRRINSAGGLGVV